MGHIYNQYIFALDDMARFSIATVVAFGKNNKQACKTINSLGLDGPSVAARSGGYVRPLFRNKLGFGNFFGIFGYSGHIKLYFDDGS